MFEIMKEIKPEDIWSEDKLRKVSDFIEAHKTNSFYCSIYHLSAESKKCEQQCNKCKE